jgi:hypothetical protein
MDCPPFFHSSSGSLDPRLVLANVKALLLEEAKLSKQ